MPGCGRRCAPTGRWKRALNAARAAASTMAGLLRWRALGGHGVLALVLPPAAKALLRCGRQITVFGPAGMRAWDAFACQTPEHARDPAAEREQPRVRQRLRADLHRQ